MNVLFQNVKKKKTNKKYKKSYSFLCKLKYHFSRHLLKHENRLIERKITIIIAITYVNQT